MKTLKRQAGFWFILPGLMGFTLFFIGPFFLSLRYAFLDRPVGGSFVGMENYVGLFQNLSYRKGLWNTLVFMGISIPLNMALSLLLALFILRMGRRQAFYLFVFLIPLVIPSGSMVFFWKSFFGYQGTLNGWLYTAGLPKVNWLETGMVRYVVIFIFLWKNIGYNMILFMAGLKNIPAEYYEAAAIDGAGPMQAFRHITFACLLPTTVLAAIMSVVNSFKVFREVYLITGSYPHDSIYMLQHFMNNMFNSLNYPKLATATSILVLLVVVLAKFLLNAERRMSE